MIPHIFHVTFFVSTGQSQIGDQLHQNSAEVHLNCEMDKQPSNHLSLEDTPSLSPLNTSESTVMQCEENPTARDGDFIIQNSVKLYYKTKLILIF